MSFESTAEAVPSRMIRPPGPLLVAAFSPFGVLGALTRYVRGVRYPVDLHLWSDVDANLHRARLHCGLARVLDVHFDRRRWRFGGDPARRDDFDPAWTRWMSDAELRERLPALLRYLDLVLPAAADGRGAVGAGAFAVRGRAVIQQEFSAIFNSAEERRRVMDEIGADLVAALTPNPVPGPVHAFTAVSDALFLDASGALVVAEIEGRRAPEVRFAAAQAIVYLRLLRRWLGSEPSALSLVAATITARRSLGLGSPLLDRVALSGLTAAVVSIQDGASPRLLAQFSAVRQALERSGVREAQDLRVELVGLDGTTRPIHRELAV
ncbi:MAG: hypothetical protein RI885_568 [Actinomycetota bacterium]|jgi:hypothetical protein